MIEFVSQFSQATYLWAAVISGGAAVALLVWLTFDLSGYMRCEASGNYRVAWGRCVKAVNHRGRHEMRMRAVRTMEVAR